ncbi:MAG: SDR family oxidoreductase [Alphaproteobacteria bacterium]|nr:SDR family oxidoreductase [Alphaproteobacteria bacterium]
MKLEDKTAVVTGAGRGIGRAMALAQAKEGARVALVARTAAEITAVAATIADAGGAAKAYALDITDLAAVEAGFAAIAADLGPIDLLTNNAGSFAAIGPIWEVNPDAWWRDIEINVRGTFHCCRAVLPQMLARGSGRIINLTGGGTATSFPHGSGYATSKAGLARFSESVNDTVIGGGVRIFAMDPGLVHTAMTDYQLESTAGQTWLGNLPDLFAKGVNVPPEAAARLSVEIGAGRFDALAGRMLAAPLDDIELAAADIAEIVENDLRSLRMNGLRDLRGSGTKA